MAENIGNVDIEKIPQYQINAIASTLLQECRGFYEDPENMRKFEQWQQLRKGKNDIQTNERNVDAKA